MSYTSCFPCFYLVALGSSWFLRAFIGLKLGFTAYYWVTLSNNELTMKKKRFVVLLFRRFVLGAPGRRACSTLGRIPAESGHAIGRFRAGGDVIAGHAPSPSDLILHRPRSGGWRRVGQHDRTGLRGWWRHVIRGGGRWKTRWKTPPPFGFAPRL